MTTLVPNEVVALVFAGDLSPMRAWREHLGLTRAEVAARAGARRLDAVFAEVAAAREIEIIAQPAVHSQLPRQFDPAYIPRPALGNCETEGLLHGACQHRQVLLGKLGL